ncbi:MAG: pyroglutamyl-peptidase I [Hyphomicrobiales bacterium]|nr:pyroglutamyl-peptidase I [Hyphomicrobiales bacterium]MDE1974470.1 pyroglutamyl-peptidase I [Hyphomicrobiales bacterium]MDE2285101.1 pyroglutamyl-peptidase I [Hyphomicrobiales bacterium]
MPRSRKSPTCLRNNVVRVLLVGFGPFPGAPVNPSAALVKALARRRRPALALTQCAIHILATSYAAVDRDLPGLLRQNPDVVLMFGLAGRRRHLCIETRARNAQSVLFPDIGGYRPQRNVISRGGPAAVRGNAPVADLLGALRGHCFPARLSRDAGRYLCNYVYWRCLRHVTGRRPLVQFVHIPPVKIGSQRKPRRGLSFQSLLAASEALLIAMIAASRR